MQSTRATSSIRQFTKASWLATFVVGLGLTACGGGGGGGGGGSGGEPTPVTISDSLKVDTTYGENGVATLPVGYTLGIQADGKLLIAGGRVTAPLALPNVGGLEATQAYVIRVGVDGAVDQSFGLNGESRFSVKGSDRPVDLQVQSNGRILVAVMAHEPCSIPSYQERCLTASGAPGSWHNTVVGLTPAGTLDNTFGTQGVGEGFISRNMTDLSLAIQSDQKPLLLTSNHFEPLQIFRRALRRLSADGQPDVAFNDVGPPQPIDIPQPSLPCAAGGEAVLALPNGNIISAGGFPGRVYPDPASDPGLCIAVHGSSQQAQTAGGWTSFGEDLKEFRLQPHPDGGFVIGARTCGASSCRLSVAKFQANGTIDASFGSQGIARIGVPANFGLLSLFTQANGSMVVYGSAAADASGGGVAQRYRAVWVSLNANGTPDSQFGNQGVMTQESSAAEPQKVLRDGAGRWLVVTSERNNEGNAVMKVQRTMGTAARNP